MYRCNQMPYRNESKLNAWSDLIPVLITNIGYHKYVLKIFSVDYKNKLRGHLLHFLSGNRKNGKLKVLIRRGAFTNQIGRGGGG